MRAPLVALAAASVHALVAPSASAYCRTTTCDPVAQSCARNADGCVRDGAPASWASLPVPYRFAEGTPDSFRNAFRSATSRWSSVECNGRRTSLRFRELAPAAGDGPFAISLQDQIPNRPPDELGLTTLSFGDRSGTVRAAGMAIDRQGVDAMPGFDLEVVLTHEIGHYLGLAHNRDPGSVMQASYAQILARGSGPNADREEARDLGEEDVRAVCVLYPPLPLTQLPSSCSASPARGATNAEALGAASAGLAVAIAATRRRRR